MSLPSNTAKIGKKLMKNIIENLTINSMRNKKSKKIKM